MKPFSIISALFVFSVKFIILPWLSVYFNSVFNLPVYSYPVFKIISVSLIILAVGILVYSFILFKKFGRGTPAPMEPPKELVIQGLYKYSRNPIYVAYLLIVLGEFFFFGHLLLLALVIFLAIGIHLAVVFWEEKALLKKFGRSYEEYCQTVPRWLF